MITTRFTQMFSLDYPLMSAPMAMHSGGRLAAAVSKAGGLGSFGGVHQTKGPDWLLAEAVHIRPRRIAPSASASSRPSYRSLRRSSMPPWKRSQT